MFLGLFIGMGKRLMGNWNKYVYFGTKKVSNLIMWKNIKLFRFSFLVNFFGRLYYKVKISKTWTFLHLDNIHFLNLFEGRVLCL